MFPPGSECDRGPRGNRDSDILVSVVAGVVNLYGGVRYMAHCGSATVDRYFRGSIGAGGIIG
jgi:hypothetical protein